METSIDTPARFIFTALESLETIGQLQISIIQMMR